MKKPNSRRTRGVPDAAAAAGVVQEHARIRAGKELLVFARHTRKWEFAHQEWNEAQLKWQWVRSRDGGSYICKVGQEVATMPVPPPPANWKHGLTSRRR